MSLCSSRVTVTLAAAGALLCNSAAVHAEATAFASNLHPDL